MGCVRPFTKGDYEMLRGTEEHVPVSDVLEDAAVPLLEALSRADDPELRALAAPLLGAFARRTQGELGRAYRDRGLAMEDVGVAVAESVLRATRDAEFAKRVHGPDGLLAADPAAAADLGLLEGGARSDASVTVAVEVKTTDAHGGFKRHLTRRADRSMPYSDAYNAEWGIAPEVTIGVELVVGDRAVTATVFKREDAGAEFWSPIVSISDVAMTLAAAS